MVLSSLNARQAFVRTGIAVAALTLVAACGNQDNSNSSTGDSAPTSNPTVAAGNSGGPIVPAGSELAIGAPGSTATPDSTPSPSGLSARLIAGSPNEKSGVNLISMDGDWPSWSGQYTGIYYDGNSGQLSIPAPAWPGQMITGVRRFDVSLTPGQEYSLSIAANDTAAATVLFLQGADGQLIAYTDADTGETNVYGAATGKDPVRFFAPDNVVAMFIQVQNAWNATAATNLVANLSSVTADQVQPREVTASNVSGTNFAGGERPAGYDTLYFGDEFNGDSLDRTKWCTRYDYGGGPPLQVPDGECTKFQSMGVLDYANAFEEQRFRDFNTWNEPMHVVSDGVIKLRATKTGTNWYAKYEAAALRGKKVFKPSWGTSYFVTARVKLPDVKGTWPSIWLNPSLEPEGVAQWPPEIDVFEGPLNRVEEPANTLVQTVQGNGAQWDWNLDNKHFESHPDYNKQWDTFHNTSSLRDRWFVVSAEWKFDSVCFYIDNVKTTCQRYRWITNSYQEANPASLLINLAIGGPWAGRYGIEEDRFPTQFELDYVRVWRNGPQN